MVHSEVTSEESGVSPDQKTLPFGDVSRVIPFPFTLFPTYKLSNTFDF